MLLVEQGFQTVDRWTQRASSSALFFSKGIPNSSPNYDIVGFTNNSGAGGATAEHFLSYSDLTLGSGTDLEDIHSVYMRMTRTNDVTTVAVGPATVIHSGGAGKSGNCYLAFARDNAGTPKVGIAAQAGGAFVLLTEVTKTVAAGDVLGISYAWNTTSSRAELVATVNGETVASINSPGGYRMSTLAAKPGVVGLNTPSLATGSGFGHWFAEWWVTNTDATEFVQPGQPYPTKVGDLKVRIMEKQRFSTDPTPKGKYLFGSELVSCEFGYKRIGGCSSAQFTVLLQDWVEGTTANPEAKSMEEPFQDDWENGDWMGGDVVISCSYSARKYEIGNFVDEDLWRGEVTKIDFDRRTKVVSITAKGLTESLRDRFVWKYSQTGETLRKAIETILASATKTGTSDGRIVSTNIIGIQSILDQRMDIDFEAISARDALEKVLRIVPDGVIWGTDRNGQFYVQQQTDHYTEDLSGGIYFPHFDADFVTTWKKTNDFNRVNHVSAFGKEVDEGQPVFNTLRRYNGDATMERYRTIRGTRTKVLTESSIVDRGLAAKLAQATLKRVGGHRITARLQTTEPIEGTRSFWHALVPFSPYISVQERLEPDATLTDPRLGVAEFYKVHDEMIRLYGDLTGYSTTLDGTSGGKISIPPTAYEQNLTGKNWMMQVSLKFTTAHGGVANEHAFVVGRSEAVPNLGWGYLSWQNTTGKLYWNYRTNGGTNRSLDTGITINSTTPANRILHFTVWRDNNGDFKFLDSGTTTATIATYRTDVIRTSTADWSIFSGPALSRGWKGDVQEFRVIDTSDMRTDGTGGPSAGVAGFLTRNVGRALRRNEDRGLLRYAKLNNPMVPGGLALPSAVCWERNGKSGSANQATWLISNIGATNTVGYVAFTAGGWRLGDSASSSTDLGLKKWGGPLVLLVESVSYRVDPGSGTVRTSFKLGGDISSFEGTIANVKRQVEIQADTLKRVTEDL